MFIYNYNVITSFYPFEFEHHSFLQFTCVIFMIKIIQSCELNKTRKSASALFKRNSDVTLCFQWTLIEAVWACMHVCLSEMLWMQHHAMSILVNGKLLFAHTSYIYVCRRWRPGVFIAILLELFIDFHLLWTSKTSTMTSCIPQTIT